jgi:hypothetical protein
MHVNILQKTALGDLVLPEFSLYNIPKREKYAKRTQNKPNDHKLYQMAVKQTKGPLNIPTVSISRPSKTYSELGFGFENKPSGNPGSIHRSTCLPATSVQVVDCVLRIVARRVEQQPQPRQRHYGRGHGVHLLPPRHQGIPLLLSSLPGLQALQQVGRSPF